MRYPALAHLWGNWDFKNWPTLLYIYFKKLRYFYDCWFYLCFLVIKLSLIRFALVMLAALLPQNLPVFFYKLAKIRLFVNLYQNLRYSIVVTVIFIFVIKLSNYPKLYIKPGMMLTISIYLKIYTLLYCMLCNHYIIGSLNLGFISVISSCTLLANWYNGNFTFPVY